MSFMYSDLFALVDCNNFYASCERLFNPALNKKPIVVLSNNDGCVIARSNEAKLLGIKMGDPFFAIEKLCKQKSVHIFSSNFALYGDISNRVMKTLHQHCPDMEIYSIDEAFIRLDRLATDPLEYAIKIKKIIDKNIGIPVSIGIAPTKTLSKIATHLAKKEGKSGVYDLRAASHRNIILKDFPVESLWGVGRKTADTLAQLHIRTAAQLCAQPHYFLQKKLGVTMLRLVTELSGVSCLSLEEMSGRKNVMCSRSFSKPVTQLSDLLQAMSTYVSIACEKARKQKSKAQIISVFIQTSPYRVRHPLTQQPTPYCSGREQQTLLLPSNDTVLITNIAQALTRKIFKPQIPYQKVGVILMDLLPTQFSQNDLFYTDSTNDNHRLMSLLDSINKRWCTGTLFLAAEGINQAWKSKKLRQSPRYTTSWQELLRV